ncbi:MAG: ABC transporter ATP-binding protein, partial [Cyanobacteria bacterium]|nr:ABC transporter ATP-binding protein [Cyanobacteriota bacterium]
FEVPDGEFWVLVGPSGCGKSTLLRTIAGLEPITAGDLYIGEQRVNGLTARQRDVAMVFQNYALYPHMTVAQNLAFGLKMRQVPKDEQQQQIQQVARSLDIEHLLDRKPRQLSGGQQQRVALGRAIARQPQLFLLDEPLSNLDAQLRDDTRAELKQLHQRFGITTLYVTHDQVEAMTLGDRIVMLDQGRIQQIGTPHDLYHHPINQRVATFIGNPPMNVLAATFTEAGLKVADQHLPVPPAIRQQLDLYPNQMVNLGIRPEKISTSRLPGPSSLALTVTVVEPLGRETLVRGTVATQATTSQPDQTLTCIVETPPTPGETLWLDLDLRYWFIFDPASGARRYPQISRA